MQHVGGSLGYLRHYGLLCPSCAVPHTTGEAEGQGEEGSSERHQKPAKALHGGSLGCLRHYGLLRPGRQQRTTPEATAKALQSPTDVQRKRRVYGLWPSLI